jgi:ABC-type glutathione transport system ATPase component
VAFIEVSDLVREFRSYRRFAGPLGPVRSLFTRQYDVRCALDGVSFTIERGEAVGYVGPNGAGKSTTIKILTGILVPTAGVARVGGLVPHLHRKENARRNFYPAALVLHRGGAVLPSAAGWATPLVGLGALLAAYGLFRRGVDRYQGAGG